MIRDGWGRNPNPEHERFNAVHCAETPCADALLREHPWTLIRTSGEDVGLPDGTMGNSEVGHQNLGAGRIVDQESVRISKSISSGAFFENPVLRESVDRARAAGRTVHLLSIASDAGVHGMLDHLYGCIELCRREGVERVAVHLFTDGRDTGPYTGKGYVEQVEARCREIGVGTVATIAGRYFAMDRDNRWERVEKAYRCLTGVDVGAGPPDPVSALQAYYDRPVSPSMCGDEFVTPTAVGPDPTSTRIDDGDTVIFCNYRGDRPRELVRAFTFDDRAWAGVKPSPRHRSPWL